MLVKADVSANQEKRTLIQRLQRLKERKVADKRGVQCCVSHNLLLYADEHHGDPRSGELFTMREKAKPCRWGEGSLAERENLTSLPLGLTFSAAASAGKKRREGPSGQAGTEAGEGRRETEVGEGRGETKCCICREKALDSLTDKVSKMRKPLPIDWVSVIHADTVFCHSGCSLMWSHLLLRLHCTSKEAIDTPLAHAHVCAVRILGVHRSNKQASGLPVPPVPHEQGQPDRDAGAAREGSDDAVQEAQDWGDLHRHRPVVVEACLAHR